jgi:micrococcal nuclease
MPGWLVAVLLGGAGVTVGTVAVIEINEALAPASDAGPVHAEVLKVVDGDTIDVQYGGKEHRVRLLNVDAPESLDPSRPVECLGEAASQFLEERLPKGTAVKLQFDEELHDRYDRELAGVFEGESLVNAEVAGAGLGVPIVIQPNDRFYRAVTDAHAVARQSGIGLYDPTVGCTIPAQQEQLRAADRGLQQAVPAPVAPSEGIDTFLEDVLRHEQQAVRLLDLLNEDRSVVPLGGYPSAELSAARTEVRGLLAGWRALEDEWKSHRARAVEREAGEQAKREAGEQAKREAGEQAKREAGEQAKREAEEQAKREPAPQPVPVPGPAPGPEPAPNPGAGYTGCRAYIGGPYIDDKGRRYTPIDCKTKAPLVP